MTGKAPEKNSLRGFLRAAFCGAVMAAGAQAALAAAPEKLFNREVFSSPVAGAAGDAEKWQATLDRHRRAGMSAAFLGVVRDTQAGSFVAKAQRVNRTVNDIVAGAEDSDVHGKGDYWAAPDETLRLGRGDCDDYSILKYFTLRAQGVPADRLFLASVAVGAAMDHMVLVMNVAEEGERERFVILDNLRGDLVDTSRSEYKFFRAFNENEFIEVAFQQTVTGIFVSFAEKGALFGLDIRARDDRRFKATYDSLRAQKLQGLELAATLIDLEMENIENFDLVRNGRLSSLDLPPDGETLREKIKNPPQFRIF